MRSILICFLLIINYLSFSQTENYINYHKTICDIEMIIINGKYDNAVEQYSQVFNDYSKPLSKDAFNATLCAVACKKYKKATYFAKIFLQNGDESLSVFDEVVGISKCKKTKHWKRLIANEHLLLKNNITPVDTALHRFFLKLLNNEQTKADSGFVYDYSFYSTTKELHKIFNTDSTALEQFFLLDKNEYLSMIMHYNSLLREKKLSIRANDSVYYNKMELSKYNLDSFYWNALKRGFFLPDNYYSTYRMRFVDDTQTSITTIYSFKDSLNAIILLPKDNIYNTFNGDSLRVAIGLHDMSESNEIFIKTKLRYANSMHKDYQEIFIALENDSLYHSLKGRKKEAYHGNKIYQEFYIKYKKLQSKEIMTYFRFNSRRFQIVNSTANSSSYKQFIKNKEKSTIIYL